MRIHEIKDKELRSLAIDRIDSNYGWHKEFLHTNKLVHAFCWENTQEGDEFWHFVNEGVITSIETKDTIVESVVNQFKERSEKGIKKYGKTLDRDDLSTEEWIEHAKQEAMDFVLYLEKLKQKIGSGTKG